jgi:hypothetical protein
MRWLRKVSVECTQSANQLEMNVNVSFGLKKYVEKEGCLRRNVQYATPALKNARYVLVA